MTVLSEHIERGERARLIPVLSDSSKEQRATSTFLATLSAVDEYGRGLLKAVGAPIGKSSRIETFTEVVFEGQKTEVKYRPDGLILVRTGKRIWSAIIEAKIGNAKLSIDQVEAYLDIARVVGADAVITISNQFASIPTHHPLPVKKQKLQRVDLFHWSWTSVLTEAIIHETSKSISGPDQAYLLGEMIHYLKHESTGISGFDRMSTSWKDLCATVQQGANLSRNTVGVADAVASWHELTRFLALEMSVSVGRASSRSPYEGAPE